MRSSFRRTRGARSSRTRQSLIRRSRKKIRKSKNMTGGGKELELKKQIESLKMQLAEKDVFIAQLHEIRNNIARHAEDNAKSADESFKNYDVEKKLREASEARERECATQLKLALAEAVHHKAAWESLNGAIEKSGLRFRNN